LLKIIFPERNFPNLNVPRHLNMKGILHVSPLGVALGIEFSVKTWEAVRILGETGERCLSTISTVSELTSAIDDVDAA
jgi:hypothetical protein